MSFPGYALEIVSFPGYALEIVSFPGYALEISSFAGYVLEILCFPGYALEISSFPGYCPENCDFSRALKCGSCGFPARIHPASEFILERIKAPNELVFFLVLVLLRGAERWNE